MKDKLYREVSVSDRLPQTDGRYLVKSHGEWFSASYLEQFSFHEEMMDCSSVTHWLEEIKLPTEEEVKNHFPLISADRTYATTLAVGQRMGANWLISALKGVSDE